MSVHVLVVIFCLVQITVECMVYLHSFGIFLSYLVLNFVFEFLINCFGTKATLKISKLKHSS